MPSLEVNEEGGNWANQVQGNFNCWDFKVFSRNANRLKKIHR